jgi:hypothetical protein
MRLRGRTRSAAIAFMIAAGTFAVLATSPSSAEVRDTATGTPFVLTPNHPIVRAVYRFDATPQVRRRGRHCCIGCGGTASGRLPSMRSLGHLHPQLAPRSAFAGYPFPPEVITLAVRWYLRFGLSYRDVEELLAERGIEVDHVSIYRWVQRFAPEFAEAARARQHIVGDRWHVDETYLKVGGTWRYLFRAIDQFGQVIDVFLSPRRDAQAARGFFERAIDRTRISPVEVTTDRNRVYPPSPRRAGAGRLP